MTPIPLIVVYCLLIVLASLLGGYLPSLVRLTHTRMQLMMSFVGGFMLGVAFFHLLPHAKIELELAVRWVLAGLLVTFFLIRFFQFHQHGHEHTAHGAARRDGPDDDSHQQARQCDHPHHHPHAFSWVGVALGLSLHAAMDGVAVAAGVLQGAAAASTFFLVGLGPFLSVLLHKPLDSLSITSLMSASGWSRRARHLVNVAYAMMCPLGAALFYVGLHQSGTRQQLEIVGCALAFSAGVFICISLGDLLPEVQFHVHDRWKLSAALLTGVLLAYAIGYVEPASMHSHPRRWESGEREHSHRHPPSSAGGRIRDNTPSGDMIQSE